MKLDLERHRLLKLLSDKTVQFNIGKLPQNESMGIPFEDLMLKMKCDREKLELISSELFLNKEIDYHDYNDVVGLFCDHNGLAAFSNKKYLKLYWTSIKESIKFWLQALIPMLSLLVALFAVTRDFKANNAKTNIQLREMKSQIELLQSQV